ncbi:uncharacterized protein LOC143034062 isoform X1 [Oratosquilla oratoria]|uniref:uncharacterized protein LOC143034062 isoform X1 n=1 Tax=Oratosquilla oratoria TaxID=337810 RepID=UPI003F76372C
MDNASQPSSSDQQLPLSEAQLQAWQKELHTRYERHKRIAPATWYSDDIMQNITVDKCFTPPKLVYKVYDINVDQLLTLKPLGMSTIPRVMTLLGPAGAGKTCICLHLLSSWSQDPKSFPGLENLDFVFFIQCRYVTTSLGQHLIKHLLPESCKDQSWEKVSQILKTYRILFLVDDYDGTKESHQLLVNEMLTAFPKSRLLLTTQLDNFVHFRCEDHEAMYGLEDMLDIKIDLHGFCITKIMEYVRKVFPNLYKSEETLKTALKEFEVHIKTLPDNFQELLRHPLNLTMYTVLWYHDQSKTKRIQTLTSLYYETVNVSVQKLAEHHHEKDSSKTLEDYISHCNQFINKLGEEALILLQRNQIHLDDRCIAQLTQVCQTLNLDVNLCLSSLLQKDTLFGPEGNQVEYWCFSSKTFHEYFAAFFLQNCVCVHGNLPDSIYSWQFFNRYVRVFWFIVGLLCTIENKLSKDILKTVVATMFSQSEYNDLHCSFVSLMISESHENETVIEATRDFLGYIPDEEYCCISNRKLLTLLRCTEVHFPDDQFTPCFVEDHDFQLPYRLQEYGCPVHLFIVVKSKACIESLAKDGKVLMLSEGVHTTLHLNTAVKDMDADVMKDLGHAWVTSFHEAPMENISIKYFEWPGALQGDETIVRIECRMATLEEYYEEPIIYFRAGKSLITPLTEMLGQFLVGVQKADVKNMDFSVQCGYSYAPFAMQFLATLKQLPFPLPEKLELKNLVCDATFIELLNHVTAKSCFLQVVELRVYDSKSFSLLQNNVENISKHCQAINVVVSHWDEEESSQKSVTQFGNWWASNCLPSESAKLELSWNFLCTRKNCRHYGNCAAQITCEFGGNTAVRFQGSQNDGKVLSKFITRFMEGLIGAGKKTMLSLNHVYRLRSTILLDLLKGLFPSKEKQNSFLQLPEHFQIEEAIFSPEFLEVATFSSSLGLPIVISQTLKVLRICDLTLFADKIDIIANCFNQIMVSVEGWEEEPTSLEAAKKLGVWWAKRRCGTAQVRNLKLYYKAVMEWECFQAITLALDNDPGPILTWKSGFDNYVVLSKLVMKFLEGVRDSEVEVNISYGDIALAEKSNYALFTALLEELKLPAPLHIVIPVASCNPTFCHLLHYTQHQGITLTVSYVRVNSYEEFLFLCDNIETFCKLHLTLCVDVSEWQFETLNKNKVQELICWWGQKFSNDGVEVLCKAKTINYFEYFGESGVMCFFGGPVNISWSDSKHDPVRLGRIMGVVLEGLVAAEFNTKMSFQVESEDLKYSVHVFLNQIQDQTLEKIKVDKSAFKPSS